jgi:two-component system cell cycle sensor histidine kinase/response regulator CckA
VVAIPNAPEPKSAVRIEIPYFQPFELFWSELSELGVRRAYYKGVTTVSTEDHCAKPQIAVPFEAAWSEEHLRSVWETSLDGFRLTDQNGRIIRVNAAYCRLFDKSRDELEGEPFTCTYHQDDQAQLGLWHAARLQGGTTPTRAEWDVRRANGSRLALDASYSVIDGKHGRVVLTVLRDMTASKQAQQQLRRNEEKFRSLVETTPDWIWEMDPAGQLTYSNAGVFAILGYRPEEIVGHSVAPLVDPEDRARLESALAGASSPNPGWKGCIIRWRHKDGTPRYLQSYAAPILDNNGLITGYRGIDHDVTGQRELLARFNQAQKLESIGRMAGGIAHDFNNLLTVILGYADQALAKLFASDPLFIPLSEIERAGRRAADLTRQLLTFSQRHVVQPELLDLNSVIAETERMLRRVIGEDVALATSLCADLKPVLVDRGQVAQVLLNLAVNARDAMPRGGDILIETSHQEISATSPLVGGQTMTAGSYVVLTFTDTGMGMDEHIRARAFEPFFTTKSPDKGSGLGLSTVYGIVKQAGGYIWVYSEQMKGTTFKIYLPAAQGTATPPATPPVPADLRGTETILLVEDQEEVRNYVVRSLQPLGYTVLAAAGAEDALRVARHYERPIDLVLSDVVMPGLPSSDMVRQVTKLHPELTRIVYMSGYPQDLVVSKVDLNQSVWYLSKPFTPQIVAAKIREVLGPRRRPCLLIVDDESAVRTFLATVLLNRGYEIFEAENGKQAVEMLKTKPIDLMISDLAMPERDGIETIQYARRAHTSIKIVSISGRFTGDVLKASRLLGADRSLAKPVSPERLIETVRELLEA